MNYRMINTSNSKQIHVYDEVFTKYEVDMMYTFAINSVYRIGEADTTVREHQGYKHLVSNYSMDDVDQFGIFNFESFQLLKRHFEGYKMYRSYMNLCTTSDKYFYHADGKPGDLTLLYYANVEWDVNWEGETPFASDDLKHIEYASPYTPGRVIIFDASIPHKSTQPLPGAPYYRFTFAAKFTKDIK